MHEDLFTSGIQLGRFISHKFTCNLFVKIAKGKLRCEVQYTMVTMRKML